ncbi:hypothetical protein ACFV9C_29080 [Kribbella sp. NPDC059898]|uniref:hypothetical protein n=1 Tax=Kribbella sp. NPDC059898 TaxID=3346995 RepID=UPI0036638B61
MTRFRLVESPPVQEQVLQAPPLRAREARGQAARQPSAPQPVVMPTRVMCFGVVGSCGVGVDIGLVGRGAGRLLWVGGGLGGSRIRRTAYSRRWQQVLSSYSY